MSSAGPPAGGSAGPDPETVTGVASHRPPTAARRPPLVLVFSITVTGILANTLVNAPLPDILADFGVGDAAAGLVVAAATLPGIVVAPLIGLAADRYGRRAVLVPCLVVFGLAGVAAAFAPSFGVLLAARLVQGFGSAGLINLAVVLLGDHWTGAERARLIGVNAAVLTVSVAVFPALGGVLTQLGGWRWSFAPYSVALVTAAAVAVLLPRAAPAAPVSVGGQVRDALAVLRQPPVLGAVSYGFVLFALVFGLFLTTLPILLEDRFGLDPAARGLMLAAPAATSTVAALTLGRARARVGAAGLLVVANVVFVIGFALIGAAPALVVVVAGALLYGYGEGSAIPTIQDLVAGRAPEASRAAVVAAWVGAARAGQTVGPLVAGAVLGAVGPGATYLLGALVAAALLGGQLGLTRVLRRRGRRPEAAADGPR